MEVAKELKYNSFGQIIYDSAPDFDFPFGFAGGIYDKDTKLIRFGVRDYDPETGRWTSVEPLGFAGSRNWYVYGADDPVGKIDLDGYLFRCTRELHALPIQIGPFYHEYLCTSDGRCAGLTTSDGSLGIFSPAKGRLTRADEDNLDKGICRQIDDDNCMDKCLNEVIDSNMMAEEYSISIYNCQSWAHDTYEYCTAQCGLYDMSNYYWNGEITYEGKAWE